MFRLGWAALASAALASLAAVGVSAAQEIDIAGKCPIYASLDGELGSFSRIMDELDISVGKPIRLVSTFETLAQGKTAATLIAARGFRADQANMSLVAHINPDIDSLDRLAVGQRLRVPLLQVFEDGHWIDYVPDTRIDGFAIAARGARLAARSAVEERDRILAELESARETNLRAFQAVDGESVLVALAAHHTQPSRELTGWSDYRDFIMNYAPRIQETERAIATMSEVLRTIEEAEGGAQLASIDFESTWQSMLHSPGGREINVVVRVFDRASGVPLEGMDVKYMNLATFQLNCSFRHGRPFSSPSRRPATVCEGPPTWCGLKTRGPASSESPSPSI